MAKHLNKYGSWLKLVSEAATKSCSIRKIFFFSRSSYCKYFLNCSGKKTYLLRSLYFFPGHFIKNKNRFITTRIQLFWSRYKLRTGVLPRIFNHSTEYLSLQDHCVCLPISSLRIRKFFSKKQTKRAKEHLSIFSRIRNHASALLFSAEQIFFSVDTALSRTLQNHWQKHTSEHLFYRTAPSGSLLCNCQLILGSDNTMFLFRKFPTNLDSANTMSSFKFCSQRVWSLYGSYHYSKLF